LQNPVLKPEDFGSIPQAMWWGIVTLTTVGYGDVHPVTDPGKMLGGVIAIIGVEVFALRPAFCSEKIEDSQKSKSVL